MSNNTIKEPEQFFKINCGCGAIFEYQHSDSTLVEDTYNKSIVKCPVCKANLIVVTLKVDGHGSGGSGKQAVASVCLKNFK
ncbi:hypothetical protein UFOVP136_59 [uncultured Caudovirales phage]|uniref:Uncharacterized protein n=1 Tax=uncultured Caudovirales phage TaxID=2100421 RepID=A0A6J5LGV3_9CAUD|nr:hypothetical protein UFOVP136_59 [uncultured Caudovirales phage]